MVRGDEPQLHVHVGAPLLRPQEVEEVLVLHAAQAVGLVLVLPGLLILRGRGKARG